MSQFPHLPLFTDAFLADTGHLDAQESGAYLLLLMMAWRTPSCCLPDDDQKLSRWARVDLRTWRRIKPTVMEFWTLNDGQWFQKRLVKVHEFASKRAEVARQNGKHGGRPKSLENKDLENPAGLSRGTQEKASILESKIREESKNTTPNGVVSEALDFDSSPEDQFWALAEPARKKGIARSRLGQLAKLHDGDFECALAVLLEAMRSKAPSAYLGKVVQNLRADDAPKVVQFKKSDEPQFVQEARQEGYAVDKRPDGTWKFGGQIYDARGEAVGW